MFQFFRRKMTKITLVNSRIAKIAMFLSKQFLCKTYKFSKHDFQAGVTKMGFFSRLSWVCPVLVFIQNSIVIGPKLKVSAWEEVLMRERSQERFSWKNAC